MWVKNEGATTHPTHWAGRAGAVWSKNRTQQSKTQELLLGVTTEGGEKYLCVSTDTTILEGGGGRKRGEEEETATPKHSAEPTKET